MSRIEDDCDQTKAREANYCVFGMIKKIEQKTSNYVLVGIYANKYLYKN